MTDLPPWVWRLIRGLADYEETHPPLFAQYAGCTEWEHADCPCHLLREVPDDILARATEGDT